MSRSGPNSSTACSTYGRRSSPVQSGAAAVFSPETLAYTPGHAAARASSDAQGSQPFSLIGGLARWSITIRSPGTRSASTGTCSRCRGSTATTSNGRSAAASSRRPSITVSWSSQSGSGSSWMRCLIPANFG